MIPWGNAHQKMSKRTLITDRDLKPYVNVRTRNDRHGSRGPPLSVADRENTTIAGQLLDRMSMKMDMLAP